MNRRNVFAAAFAALFACKARAQSGLTPKPNPQIEAAAEPLFSGDVHQLKDALIIDGIGWKAGRTVADQCPTCGTMAEPYVRPMHDKYQGVCKVASFNQDGTVTCEPPLMVPDGPAARVTRCKQCNSAFWQDATN